MWLVLAAYLYLLYITEHLTNCCALTVLLEYLDLHVIIIIVVYNYGCPGTGTQVALVLPTPLSKRPVWLKLCTAIVIWYVYVAITIIFVSPYNIIL